VLACSQMEAKGPSNPNVRKKKSVILRGPREKRGSSSTARRPYQGMRGKDKVKNVLYRWEGGGERNVKCYVDRGRTISRGKNLDCYCRGRRRVLSPLPDLELGPSIKNVTGGKKKERFTIGELGQSCAHRGGC